MFTPYMVFSLFNKIMSIICISDNRAYFYMACTIFAKTIHFTQGLEIESFQYLNSVFIDVEY